MMNDELLPRLFSNAERPVPERPAHLHVTAEQLRAKLAAKTPDEVRQLAEIAENAYHAHILAPWADQQHAQSDVIGSGSAAAFEAALVEDLKKIKIDPGDLSETDAACERAQRSTTTVITPSGDIDAPAAEDRAGHDDPEPARWEELSDSVVRPCRCNERSIRMGLILDIVGYGKRDSPGKDSLQRRLAHVVRLVLDDLSVTLTDTELQGTGDGVVIILPQQLDVQRALPVLLRSLQKRLIHDNATFSDRMRVRMAVGVGPVGLTELGFGGAMVTNIGRLLDSRPLRRWEAEHPEHDLSVAVSEPLYRFVVAEGVRELPREQFVRVQVRVKELATTAWLWTR
jgi:hypothetical protein